MIKLAFWYDFTTEYTGGLNYIRNLLYALSVIKDKAVIPYVFIGKKTDPGVIRRLAPYATIVQTSVIDRKSVLWYVHKCLFKFFKSVAVADIVLARHGISVVFSHAGNIYSGNRAYKLISWIPDFQYLHLPELFPGLNVEAESSRLRAIVRHSDMVLMSSQDALRDFKSIIDHEMHARGRVLPFVSQLDDAFSLKHNRVTGEMIENKYGVNGKFFFLPNQFWAHKNHILVFSAVKLLKEQGVDVRVICSGNLYDYRLKNTSYADGLRAFVATHGLESNIRLLGLIDYDEVVYFMKNSIAVLNPSKFEGWSSTVEEAKSIGKTVILSKIAVHVEQNPSDCRYFAPDDVDGLAQIMRDIWGSHNGGIDAESERKAQKDLGLRTLAYGQAFCSLLSELSGVHVQ